MTHRENVLRAIRFERPEWIPMQFAINPACWNHYPQESLLELMDTHPLLFPGWSRPAVPVQPEFSRVARKNSPYTDDFGCLWQTTEDGITGTVTRHPLGEWEALAEYVFPDPEACTGIGPIDWTTTTADITAAKNRGDLTWGGLRHGHTFLQLCDLRGYQNLLFDMADGTPELMTVMERLEAFNAGIVSRYCEAGVDIMGYAEDLGMQKGPMLSPEHFRRYIKPTYQRLMRPARERGIIVHMHSDGDIRDLVEDLIDGGVEVLNLQDLVNGIDWIAERFAGKTCIDLDIDRQAITYGGTPAQIDELIRIEVDKIGRREGGLMMVYGLYPGVPLANVKALMDAMERYMHHFNG